MSPIITRGYSGRWSPILENESEARHFERILDELASILSAPQNASQFQGGLSSGPSGAALFFQYMDQFKEGQGYDLLARRFLEAAAKNLSNEAYGPGLFGGIAGVAWTFEHLGLFTEEDANADIDEALIAFLKHRPWTGDYDLIYGLAGLGLYGLERFPRASGFKITEEVIHHLDALKINTDEGITWHTPPENLPQWQRDLYPNGYYNLGAAHGVPAVMTFLGQALTHGVLPDTTSKLLKYSTKWLLSKKINKDSLSHFPTVIPLAQEEGQDWEYSRIAWCYGDLGLSVCLLSAAHAMEDAHLREEALKIAQLCARRDMTEAGDHDAAICHGASGNAHLFNRLYHCTGEEVFRAAALEWFRRILKYHSSGKGVAGFCAFQPSLEDPTKEPWVPKWGFLEGAVGIALCILGGLSSIEPNWDRVLAVRLPSNARTGPEPSE